MVAGEVFYNRSQARREIADYIEGSYKSWHRHSALGYLSPAASEEKVA
jgi:transposase InsO family protein